MKNLIFNEKGAIPLLVLIAIIGLVAFFAISTSFPFKDKTLTTLYPKEESMAAPGDELPCVLPNNYQGVCTGFNNYPNNTPFMSVPELVAEWDVRIGQVDAYTPGRPVVMHKCGKNDGLTLVEDPDQQLNLCAHHLMDNMFETGNLGAITYRARESVDMNDGYVTFTADLNTTARQTIHVIVSDSIVRYPVAPSWAGPNGDQHDIIGHGFSLNFGRGSLSLEEHHGALGVEDSNMGWHAPPSCMGIDDRRCKMEVRFNQTGVEVTIDGNAYGRRTFQRAMPFTKGNLALVRQQYNPTKDCGPDDLKADCPGFQDIWLTDGPWPDGRIDPNASVVEPRSLYPGTLYMGYDTTHWDNLGFKSSQVRSRVVAGTAQKTIYTVDSPQRNPSSGYQSTKVNINHPTGGANGRLVFSAAGWDGQFSQVRVNGGAWQNLPYTGDGWRTKIVDNLSILQGNNVVEFRSTRTQGICCPPQNGWGFNVHRIDLEAITAGSVPTATPTSTPTPSPTPTTKVGDLNNDNSVNALDFAILLSKWNTIDPVADLNKDGTVGLVDFSILLSKWGT